MGTISISRLSNSQLIDAWESTTNNKSKGIDIVRGWLMDELEKRWPEAFDAWLDGNGYDDEFKNFI